MRIRVVMDCLALGASPPERPPGKQEPDHRIADWFQFSLASGHGDDCRMYRILQSG